MPVWRATISATYNGRIMQNVIHLWSPDTEITLFNVAGKISDLWLPEILGAQSHSIVYFQIEVRQVEPSGVESGQVVAININGNGSSDVHHACMSYKLLFRTGLLGVKNRGRYYIPACVQGFTTADLVNNAGNTFLGNAALQLTIKFTGSNPSSGLNLVIWHRGPESGWTMVDRIVHSNVLGIQSRRNVNRGI